MSEVTTEVTSTHREGFEEGTFPHLGALLRAALWLTRRQKRAENLVLKTMTRAYRMWQVSEKTVGVRAWLFRILAREFAHAGYSKCRSGRFLSEEGTSAPHDGDGSPHSAVSIKPEQLSALSAVPNALVNGAIARLRTPSRFILMLLWREGFSYAEIAYITDLRKDSVKSILSRLRRVISRYLLQTQDSTVETQHIDTVRLIRGASFDTEPNSLPRNSLATFANYTSTVEAPIDRWENEGGSLKSVYLG